MAPWSQDASIRPVFWNTAQLSREVVSRLGGFGRRASAREPKANGSNGEHLARREERYLVKGIWVQIAYVLIDASLVIANGSIAFLLRFSPVRRQRVSRRAQLSRVET